MTREEEYHYAVLKYETGKRLMQNKDYKEVIGELEEELASSWMQLKEADTTDPHIARIQAKLHTLELTINIARSWVKKKLDMDKELINTELVEPEGDYENG